MVTGMVCRYPRWETSFALATIFNGPQSLAAAAEAPAQQPSSKASPQDNLPIIDAPDQRTIPREPDLIPAARLAFFRFGA